MTVKETINGEEVTFANLGMDGYGEVEKACAALTKERVVAVNKEMNVVGVEAFNNIMALCGVFGPLVGDVLAYIATTAGTVKALTTSLKKGGYENDKISAILNGMNAVQAFEISRKVIGIPFDSDVLQKLNEAKRGGSPDAT